MTTERVSYFFVALLGFAMGLIGAALLGALGVL